MYYGSLGIQSNTTLRDFIIKVTDRVIPAYGSVTRSIRKCRERNPKWKRK